MAEINTNKDKEKLSELSELCGKYSSGGEILKCFKRNSI
jgi:hypothetical protein